MQNNSLEACIINTITLVRTNFQDGTLQIFEGKCEGHISNEGRGEVGFGFDPIFIPSEQDSNLDILDQPTFSQLSLEISPKS